MFETYYTTDQAAAIAGVHRQTVGDALRSGELHGVQRKKRGNWRIPEAALRAWMNGAAKIEGKVAA